MRYVKKTALGGAGGEESYSGGGDVDGGQERFPKESQMGVLPRGRMSCLREMRSTSHHRLLTRLYVQGRSISSELSKAVYTTQQSKRHH